MIINKMASSIDPDEMAQYATSVDPVDLHCLYRFIYQATGLKGLTYI